MADYKRSKVFEGNYSFDYTSLCLDKDIQVYSSKKSTKNTVLDASQIQGKDKNSWHKAFTKRLEFSILNQQIKEHLKTKASVQQDWLIPCLKRADGETNSAIRRRCFCDTIGAKFCAVCRRQVNKELSNDVPRIICELRNSGNRLEFLERVEYFVTPEPKFCRQLKQASRFHRIGGYDSLQGDQSILNDKELCLSIENPQGNAMSRSSSCSLTSSEDEIVPSSPRNSPCISPAVPALPIIHNPNDSPDIPKDRNVFSTVPQLPVIENDTETLSDSQIFITDIPEDQHISTAIPQHPAIPNNSNIPNDSQIFHITRHLRSINELKADSCLIKEPSNHHLPPVIHELSPIPVQGSDIDDSQNGKISTESSESNLSKSISQLDDGCNSKTNIQISSPPKLPHPVEPVLLELKYINFSIYDNDCNKY